MKLEMRTLFAFLIILSSVLPSPAAYGVEAAKPKILAISDCAYPPFEFMNEHGNPDGFNVELFKAVMKELNLEYELKGMLWDHAAQLLREKKADVLTGMADVASRHGLYLFSTPHNYLYTSIICRKGSPINYLSDLKDKSVILQKGDISAEVLDQYNISNHRIMVSSIYDGLRLLSRGRNDAAVCSDIMAQDMIRRYKFENLELRHLPSIPPFRYGFAINIDRPELKILLDDGLERVKAKGIYSKIYDKWFAVPQRAEISRSFYLVIGILIFIVLVSNIVIYIIRKHIRKVTSKLNAANKDLRDSLFKTQLAIKTSNLLLWDYDCDTQYVHAFNDPLMADNQNHIIPINEYLALVHPDDLEKAKSLSEHLSSRTDQEFSIDLRLKPQSDAKWLHLTIDGAPLKDKEGKVIKYTGFRKDNTILVELNEQLSERNLHLNMALQNGSIIPAVMDTRTNIISMTSTQIDTQGGENNNYTRMVSLSDIISKIHPDSFATNAQTLEQIKNGTGKKGTLEIQFYVSDTQCDYFDINYIGTDFDKSGNPRKLVGYFQNITKRKIAEAKLMQQKELMNHILDFIPIPIHIKDIDNGGVYVYWNNESTKMLGTGDTQTTVNLITEEQVEQERAIDRQVYETGIPYVGHEHLTLRNGKELETIVHKNIIYDGDKKLILVTRWDIGEQKDLYRKSKILSISMDALKAFTWFCDLRNGILKFGDNFEKTGGSPSEMNSLRKFAQRIHPRDRQRFIDFITDFCKQDSGDFSIEYEIDLAGNGNYAWWECRGSIEIEDKDSIPYKYIYGMDINIDSLKKSELHILKAKEEMDVLNKQTQLILNNANTGLVFLDKDYKVQWENLSVFFPNHSMTKNYAKGFICHQAVKGLDYPCPGCIVAKSRVSSQIEFKEICVDGQFAELTANPVFDKQNNQIGTVLKVVDITEKKKITQELEAAKNKAEASNRLMLNIFDRLPCMLFIKDIADDFRYIIANNYFCDMLGKPHSEVIGHTDFEIFEQEEAEKFRSDDTVAIRDTAPFVFEEDTWWQGKHTVWQTTKAMVNATDGRQIMIAVSLDITEKIQAYRELEDAKEKAEQSNKLKSAFLANMSHEIRTPLNAIVGFSEIMSYTTDETERKEFSNIIHTNNELLLGLINDILDLSKIEAGMMQLHPERFDVSELFNRLSITLSQRITSPDVKLLCEIPSEHYTVELDKNRFTQVITNFATNAIKFTPKGEIKIGYQYTEGGIKVYVTDTGIGIAADKINKVFERFEKLDDFAQGTGLGMAICKAIMEACNGKIGLESELGKGSTFWAWFPEA